VPFKRPPVLRALDARAQLLGDYDAEVFERREHVMELL